MHEVLLQSSYYFLLLFLQFELSNVSAQLLPKHIDTGFIVNATPPTILAK